jgi:hypothetical protein
MNKKTLTTLIIVILVIIGAVFYMMYSASKSKTSDNGLPTDPHMATFTIDGQPATLGDSSNTKYFGNEAKGDLNGDGLEDVAFLITQSPGGSGTFYYAVVALKTSGGYVGTNGVLLGDRVAPQTTEIKNGQLVVNYADRKPTDPMTTAPSVGMTKYLVVSGTTLSETNAVVGAGQHCGGNMTTAPKCADGYICMPNPGSNLPFGDVGGICVQAEVKG